MNKHAEIKQIFIKRLNKERDEGIWEFFAFYFTFLWTDISCVPWGKLLNLTYITELQWKKKYIYTHTHIVPKIFWELHVLFYHYICFTFLTEKTYHAVIKTNIKMKVPIFKNFFHTSTVSCLLVNNFTQKMLWMTGKKKVYM